LNGLKPIRQAPYIPSFKAWALRCNFCKAYYQALSTHRIKPLDWNKLPIEMGLRETDLVYRQNRIPRDPYSILPEHVDQVKKVVDDMINELDQLLQGRVRAENWLGKDTLHLVHPPSATIADLPSEPSGE